MKKVILFGSTNLSKMLFYDAVDRKDFEIACFTVEKDYRQDRAQLLGLPLVIFEEIQDLYPPDEFDMAVLFHGIPRMLERAEKYLQAKSKGYQLRNYISRRADITPEISMGDNTT